MPAIKIVLDITRLVEEGKLTAQEAERLQALARRDTGSLAINVLMSFGAVAVAAGIIALEPAFTTGAALGVVLVAIGLAISFFAAEQWGLLGTATTIIGALLLAGGVIGFAEADFAGLAFSALLFLALAVAIRSGFLMALVPLALAGALGSSTGYMHAVYMLTVNEPSITIAFFCAPRRGRVRSLAARRSSLSAVGDYFCPSITDPHQFRLLDRLAVGRLSRRDLGARRRLPVVV
jgi:iron complex transport system permease protein